MARVSSVPTSTTYLTYVLTYRFTRLGFLLLGFDSWFWFSQTRDPTRWS